MKEVGVLDQIELKTASNGREYANLTISGVKYSLWDVNLCKVLSTGQHVAYAFTTDKKGYKVLSEVMPATRPLTGADVLDNIGQPAADPRRDSIERQVALKTAVEMMQPMMAKALAGMDQRLDVAQAVTEVADIFANWLKPAADEPEAPGE